MKINGKQKRTLIYGIILILVSILVWLSYGGEIFTKSEVLIEKHDELLGTTYKEWKEQFVLGLDYTFGFIGTVVFLFSIIFWKQRNKDK